MIPIDFVYTQGGFTVVHPIQQALKTQCWYSDTHCICLKIFTTSVFMAIRQFLDFVIVLHEKAWWRLRTLWFATSWCQPKVELWRGFHHLIGVYPWHPYQFLLISLWSIRFSYLPARKRSGAVSLDYSCRCLTVDAANVLLPVRAGEPKPVAIGQGMLESQIITPSFDTSELSWINEPSSPKVSKVLAKNLRYKSTWGVEFVSDSCNLVNIEVLRYLSILGCFGMEEMDRKWLF